MSCRYGVYAQGSVVLEYWWGQLDKETIIRSEQMQAKDPAIADTYQVLASCKDCELNLTQEDVYEIAKALHQGGSSRANRIALVLGADQEQNFHSLNQYSVDSWSSGVEIMLFFNLESACAWLELDTQNVGVRLQDLQREVSEQL